MTNPAVERHFGPSALATPANAVTAGRVVLLPFLVWAMVARHDGLAVSIWIVLGLSDSLDGLLARRQGATRSGAYLDPLADKMVVLTALAVLAGQHRAPWLAVALIAVREAVISVWRSIAARRGISIPAGRGGKLKTVLQIVSVGFFLIPVRSVALVLLWLAVVVAWASGADYLVRGVRAS
jgi:CDP-diacylglycerol--glycerol-3-phosphate 3-phosphatidyltransferase